MSQWGSTHKNTHSNGLILPSSRNPSPNMIPGGREGLGSYPMIVTSSENTGDVMVENVSLTKVLRWPPT